VRERFSDRVSGVPLSFSPSPCTPRPHVLPSILFPPPPLLRLFFFFALLFGVTPPPSLSFVSFQTQTMNEAFPSFPAGRCPDDGRQERPELTSRPLSLHEVAFHFSPTSVVRAGARFAYVRGGFYPPVVAKGISCRYLAPPLQLMSVCVPFIPRSTSFPREVLHLPTIRWKKLKECNPRNPPSTVLTGSRLLSEGGVSSQESSVF